MELIGHWWHYFFFFSQFVVCLCDCVRIFVTDACASGNKKKCCPCARRKILISKNICLFIKKKYIAHGHTVTRLYVQIHIRRNEMHFTIPKWEDLFFRIISIGIKMFEMNETKKRAICLMNDRKQLKFPTVSLNAQFNFKLTLLDVMPRQLQNGNILEVKICKAQSRTIK